KDSLGNWVNPPYNVAKWNGQGWELFTTSDIGYGYGELYCVFAFGPNDIWVGSSIPEHWDGQRWKFHGSTRGYQGGFRIRKIWGTSSRDLYVVGDGGNIRYFNGVSWRRLESGTDLDVYDIYGDKNLKTGETEIYAVAAKQYVTFDKIIFRIDGIKVTAISIEGIPYNIHGIWFKAGVEYYVVGSGMYHKRNPMQPGPWKGIPASVTQYGIYKIKGNNINDIFACGSF
ncbi:MAG: hypothetical protein QME58_14470, partial [Bacteroidota bacterium]|nr:hypothetical protein [Bacteroidota bacterium]